MKRTLSLILSLLMVFSLFAVLPASAAVVGDAPTGNQIASSGSTDNCTWTLNEETGVLTISAKPGSSGQMDFEPRVFDGDTRIKKIVITSGIIGIGNYTFYNAYALTEVVFPESLLTIGNYAFQFCDKLTSVSLPSKLMAIGYGAFFGCESLTSVTFPSSIKEIGGSAFANTGLTEVFLPGVTTETIGDHAFGFRYANRVWSPVNGFKLTSCTEGSLRYTEKYQEINFNYYGTSYDLWVGATLVQEDNFEDILGDGTASYDPATKTLTLNNPVITTSRLDRFNATNAILSEDSELTVKGVYHMTEANANYGISSNSGSLTFDGDFVFYGGYDGVYALQSITVRGGSLTAVANGHVGLYSGGLLFIENGADRVEFSCKRKEKPSALNCAVRAYDGFMIGDEMRITLPANAIIYGGDIFASDGESYVNRVVIENPNAVKYILGDVDGDGKVDIFDASSIQKSIAGVAGYPNYDTTNPNDYAFRVADIDGNGVVDIFDAALIQKWIAGSGAAQSYGIGNPVA